MRLTQDNDVVHTLAADRPDAREITENNELQRQPLKTASRENMAFQTVCQPPIERSRARKLTNQRTHAGMLLKGGA